MNELELVESPKGPSVPYPTTNLRTAAMLRAVGHKLLNVRRQGGTDKGPRVEFVFDHNDVKDTLLQWLNDEVRVNARTLYQNEDDLKNLVHNCQWKEEEGTQPKRKKRRRRRSRGGNKSEPTEPVTTVDNPETTVPAG